ncbi:MAG: hypothetical protein HYY16_10250 [Planctomycetes bacterium]|nr:hypothetical protein [Planctomycetota bacterium]
MTQDLLWEPLLVEEIVRHEVESRPSLRLRYRQALDETYRGDASRRLMAAHHVHQAFFAELDWPAFFRSLLAPLFPRVTSAGIFRTDRNEGCFIDDQRRLQIRLRPERFSGDRENLRRYLRHELAHVEDILDPAFGYRIEPLDEPTRKRYARLWCDSIDARRRGEALEPVTHAGLLQRARSMGRPKCPLCALPTVQWASPTPSIVERIRLEYMNWSPEQGVCERCAEWAELTLPRR